MEFSELYQLASQKLNPRKVSPFISAGGVASAILTKDGHVYVGVCIDTACTLGMCAERNAIANIPITNQDAFISHSLGCQGKAKHDVKDGSLSNVTTQYWYLSE